MAFGGFSTAQDDSPRPEGAVLVAASSSVWRLGDAPARHAAVSGGRRIMLLGWCGATSDDLRRLAEGTVPDDVAWRWPGAYTVVKEAPGRVVLYTDPADAAPLYLTALKGGWAWSTSARLLAGLTAASVDTGRLACSILASAVPVLGEHRSFFAGVQHLPAGSRIELPADGAGPWIDTVWRLTAAPGLPQHRLREALTAAVALRVDSSPGLSSDLSGGLDSTSLAVLAATCRPRRRPLMAVTMHPDGDTTAADLHYARLAAAHHRDRIDHQLFATTAAHLPYRDLDAVPVSDEPAPSTLSHVQLIAQMAFVRDRGSTLHLTGDGGDSVLCTPPAHLADLLRHGHWPRAVTEAMGLARLRHRPLTPLLRDAAALARTRRRDALAALAPALPHLVGHRPARDELGWFPPLAAPPWARPEALRLLADAAFDAAERPDALPGVDIAVRTLVDTVRDTARTAAADAEVAAAAGVDLHAPFLDAHVVDAVLRTPLIYRPPVHAYKPILRRAMAHLLPPALASRTTKDHANADHYAGIRAALPTLLELADGHLAQLGLVDPGRLRSHLRQAAAGIAPALDAIEQALCAEAWLRAHHAQPAPAWTVPTGSTR